MPIRRTRGTLLLAAAVAVAASAIALLAPRAHAITANSSAYTILYIAEDGFRNWDFHCNSSSTCISPTNVDWPMGLLFYNNAEINKVKDNILSGLYPYGGTCASGQYSRMNDGAGWGWDGDSGRKTVCCPIFSWARHIRFYANGSVDHDRMYNTAWGYWIMASTHYDYNEPQCSVGGSSFGYNETAEQWVYSDWTSTLGRPGWYDQQSWANAQSDDQGDHHLRNDGLATVLWVS